jgi:hypothetical protein
MPISQLEPERLWVILVGFLSKRLQLRLRQSLIFDAQLHGQPEAASIAESEFTRVTSVVAPYGRRCILSRELL